MLRAQLWRGSLPQLHCEPAAWLSRLSCASDSRGEMLAECEYHSITSQHT